MNRKTILAIDDESTCLEVITFALESRGYKVFTAENGRDGINLVANQIQNIDLILLDMMLPDMYGLEALGEIKKILSTRNIPIVMQTGTSNDDDLKKAVRMGAVKNIIRKPYGRADLLSVVEGALGSTEL